MSYQHGLKRSPSPVSENPNVRVRVQVGQFVAKGDASSGG